MSGNTDPKRNRIISLALLAVLLMSVSLFLASPKESDTIVVSFPNGTTLETEVADTPEKQLFGLAFREALPADAGMLYIFEATGTHRVSTRQYRAPVDMIWLDESRHVVEVTQNVPPCVGDPCPLYGPAGAPVRYVIQTAAGFALREAVSSGAELRFALRM